MQCELLISDLKDPKTILLVKENIGRISGGSSSRSASALEFGLKKAFEFKKQIRQPPGVQLRCLEVVVQDTIFPSQARLLGRTPIAQIVVQTTCSALGAGTTGPATIPLAKVAEDFCVGDKYIFLVTLSALVPWYNMLPGGKTENSSRSCVSKLLLADLASAHGNVELPLNLSVPFGWE